MSFIGKENDDPERILDYKVMVPIEIRVSIQIANHQYGKWARVIFDYLLAANQMRLYREGGWISVSQAKLHPLGLTTKTRRRGLLALEELGLVELRQEGKHTYYAKLAYSCPVREVRAGPSNAEERERLAKQIATIPNDTDEYFKRRQERAAKEKSA